MFGIFLENPTWGNFFCAPNHGEVAFFRIFCADDFHQFSTGARAEKIDRKYFPATVQCLASYGHLSDKGAYARRHRPAQKSVNYEGIVC